MTGVQTCALPISAPESDVPEETTGPKPNAKNSPVTCNEDLQSPSVILVCISTGADMDVIRSWSNSTAQVGHYPFSRGILAVNVVNTCRDLKTMAHLQKL